MYPVSKVSIVRCCEYDFKKVKEAIQKVLEPLGGLSQFVRPNTKVLLKPNCLTDSLPQKAVTTHPVFLGAVIEMAKECGARVFVGDSPGIKPLSGVLKKTGMYDVIVKSGAEVIEFKGSGGFAPDPSDTFRQMELAKEIKDGFTIINLPKLKTHVYMQLTLAIKNIFGCIVGLRKSQWHFRCGTNMQLFTRMLVDNYKHVSPPLTILDGIIGMDGNGPVNGRVRHFDIIAASADGVSLDRIVAHLAGFGEGEYQIINAAREKHAGETDLNKIDFIGGNLEDFVFDDFQRAQNVIQGNPALPFIPASLMKSLFTTKPKQNKAKCILCGECVKICPIGAIRIEAKNLKFDYDNCIRCFCCHEICQYGGIDIYKNLLNRIPDLIK